MKKKKLKAKLKNTRQKLAKVEARLTELESKLESAPKSVSVPKLAPAKPVVAKPVVPKPDTNKPVATKKPIPPKPATKPVAAAKPRAAKPEVAKLAAKLKALPRATASAGDKPKGEVEPTAILPEVTEGIPALPPPPVEKVVGATEPSDNDGELRSSAAAAAGESNAPGSES